jgi:hypothetical protein
MCAMAGIVGIAVMAALGAMAAIAGMAAVLPSIGICDYSNQTTCRHDTFAMSTESGLAAAQHGFRSTSYQQPLMSSSQHPWRCSDQHLRRSCGQHLRHQDEFRSISRLHSWRSNGYCSRDGNLLNDLPSKCLKQYREQPNWWRSETDSLRGWLEY